MNDLLKNPSAPYVAPMVVLLAFVSVAGKLGVWEFPVQCVVLAGVLLYFSRNVISFKTVNVLGSIALGVAVFFLWIAPDALVPGWREHWLFTNSITGKVGTTIAEEYKTNILLQVARTFRAVVLVAIIEELFWRAWMLRWLAKPDFQSLPLGSATRNSFLLVAVLFAAAHGVYWEVALATGLIYNWWMTRTKSLADCIVVHGTTNLVLSIYVIAFEQWQYWM